MARPFRGIPRLPRARRRTAHLGDRARPGLGGGATPRRGHGGAGPRQDTVLQQHQPRAPHAADADARPHDGRAPRARADARGPTTSRSSTATRSACKSWSGACSTSRASRRDAPACRSSPSASTPSPGSWPTPSTRRCAMPASRTRSAASRCRTSLLIDPDMWEKILLNLISNALKFTFEGKVRVSLAARGEEVELEVADTGTGIPAHELPRVFDRFHRVQGARARTQEGSGIGLALVHELARLLGGDVVAKSAVDSGTTMTVTIPAQHGRRVVRRFVRRSHRGAGRDARGGQPVRRGGAPLAAERGRPFDVDRHGGPRSAADRRRPAAGARPGRGRQRRHARVPGAHARPALVGGDGRRRRGRPHVNRRAAPRRGPHGRDDAEPRRIRAGRALCARTRRRPTSP